MIGASAALNGLRLGRVQTARLGTSDQGIITWVGVYPLFPKEASTEKFLKFRKLNRKNYPEIIFRLRSFNVKRTVMSENRHICEDDLSNLHDEVIFSIDELEERLLEFGLNVADLKMPYSTGYPI